MLRFGFFQSLAISLFAVSILSGCNPAYYDPIVPEVLVGQGVHRDGGTCYFMIIWEIDTEPHFPEHFRNWGYRIRVENSGEEFLKEEYKTIEEVLVRDMPGANWEYDEESLCWLVPFTMPANLNLMPRGYRVEVIIASDYKQYGSVQELDDGINQWMTVYQGIQFGRF